MKKTSYNPLESVMQVYNGELDESHMFDAFAYLVLAITTLGVFNISFFILDLVLFIGFFIFFCASYKLSLVRFTSIQNYLSEFDFTKYKKEDVYPALLHSNKNIGVFSYSFSKIILILSIPFQFYIDNIYIAVMNLLFIISFLKFSNNLDNFVKHAIDNCDYIIKFSNK